MNYRNAVLWPRTNYTADKTEVIDIKVKDPISRIVVIYEPDNNPAAAHATAHPAKCITKIELVDGSEVLFSLSGQQAQAVDFYDREKVTPSKMVFLNGMYSQMIFNLNFGRYLFDRELAFDPKHFNNPQLRITIDINGGGDTSDDGYLTVIAHMFDELAITPLGFLMSKQVKQFTFADASHEYTDLPTDYVYRQLYLAAQRYGTSPASQVDTVKLDEDMDKRVPLDLTMEQVVLHVAAEWPMYEEAILVATNTTTGENYYCTPTHNPRFTASQWRSAGLARGIALYSGNGGRFTHSMDTVNCNVAVHALGPIPHAVVPLLGKPGSDPGEWYNVAAVDKLRLDVKGAASVGTAQTGEIIIQQLRSY